MNEPKSLDELFNKKIFRIPDYQRGYAWQEDQYKDFWEDLINLSDDRKHYTGVLTLKKVNSEEIKDTDNEFWLVDDHSYSVYHIVDGQQRLTTCMILLQAFIECVKQIDENHSKSIQDIFITDSLSLKDVVEKYLYRTKPKDNLIRTYKFGYMVDNPSYYYLRYKIFNEEGVPSIEDSFYTLNLKNAKIYFDEQLKELFFENGIKSLKEIYKKLSKKFLFNEYVIEDEFDVFVAFETMNNRGKRLSDLELLKNRLIYLTTLYSDKEVGKDDRSSLRASINAAWKEVYYQLGRNDKRRLNDDDFLKAHWIMYFQYSRKKGNDYIKFLLDEQFSPQRIHKKTIREVTLELPEEQLVDIDVDELDIEHEPVEDEKIADLKPLEIKNYVDSLKESVVHWFNSYNPHLATELSDEEKNALDRLNRIGMGYFRPLIMSALKNEKNPEERIDFLDHIERFIFIVFRLSQARSNYGDSKFYSASRELNQGKSTLAEIKQKLDEATSSYWNEDGTFNSKYFHDYLDKRFNINEQYGYYGWHGLRYFLYEYELKLLSTTRQNKVTWDDLLKTPKDKLSIEHVFPQTPNDDWKKSFEHVDEKDYHFYNGSIGNLLLLSMSINSSLQNGTFSEKKEPKYNDHDVKIRNGYLDGSHSEIVVAQNEQWTPAEIKERGMKLLNFMEERWGIKFLNEETKEALLFLERKNFDNNEDD